MSTRNQHEMLARSIAIASEAHAGQLDRGGLAYILHCIRVMNNVGSSDPELMQIAILHDTVEDSDWTIAALVEEGFSPRVIEAVSLLTKTDEKDYQEYINLIGGNHDALRVKIADLRDNSDITRLKGVRQKDIERIEKYHRSYMFLNSCKYEMEARAKSTN